ncbi:MAG: hypothetical protein ACQETK_02430 [Pseudomonadota bacterium]
MKSLTSAFLFCCLLLPGLAAADKPGDSRALTGIDTGRILWDITIDDPDRLISRLSVIEETYDDMLRQDVQPMMIFTFRGGAAGLLARNPDHIELEDASAVTHVHKRLQDLLGRSGVHMEACAIATRRFGLEQQDLIPGVQLVGNTFLSIMGYRHKGYTAIRID